jgi:hypothetical protein
MLNSKGSLLSVPVVRFFTKSNQIMAVLVLLGAVQATAQVAILHPSGAVSVNNVSVSQATPVFSGDKIATGSGGTATIQSSGNQVSMPSGSSVVYGTHEVQVFDNGATISSVNGMTARFEGLTVSSSPNTAAEFEVRKDTSGTMVIATSGTLSVSDGHDAKSLDAGNSLVHSAWHPASMLSSNHQDPWSVQAWHDDDDHHHHDRCDDRGGGGGHGHDHGHDSGGYAGSYWIASNRDHDGGGDGDRDHDHDDCECKHKDHHGHPESPIRPCRGDRHDEHCRCHDDDGGGDGHGHGHDR